MDIGYIGLGKMGLGMAARMKEKGYGVVATDPSEEAREKAKSAGIETTATVAGVAESLPARKIFWLMVPHNVVDDVLGDLLPTLKEGDVIIDGGNSNFNETLRRAKEIEAKGIHFLDVGVSGGPSGARDGACMMVGGEKVLYQEFEQLFKDLSVEGGFAHVGPHGAGHYVKMVHNGIEYGMMQAIGEGFDVMKHADFDLDLEAVTHVYEHGSVIESRLISWLAKAYKEEGVELEAISGEVAHSGEGLWTVEEAKRLGINVPIIEGSLQFREDSKGNPSYTGKVVSALRNQFGGHNVRKDGGSTT